MADVNITVEVSGIDQARFALDQLEDSIDRLRRASGRFTVRTREAGEATRMFGRQVEQAARSMDKSAEATRKKSGALRRVIVNLNRFLGKIRVITFAIGALTAVIVALRDEIAALGVTIGGVFAEVQLESARDRMEAFTGSLNVARDRIQAFNDIATTLGFRFIGIVDQMGRLEIAATQAGLSFGESTTLMEAFMSAASDLGVTTDDTASILEDLTGIVREGRVEMADLVELLEFTNRPVEILADAFGETEAAIRAMAEAGVETRVGSLLPLARALQRTEPVAQGLTGAFNRLFNTAIGLLDVFNQTGVIDAMVRQMERLSEILASPQAVVFMERMGAAMTEFIDTTLPAFASSFIESWETILDTLRSVAGFMIGAALGGLTGGVIGAIIGAHDDLREAFLDAAGAAGSFAFDVIKATNDVEAEVSPAAEAVSTALSALATAASATAFGFVEAFNDVEDAVSAVADAFERLSQTGFMQAVLDLLGPLLDRINELGTQGLSIIRDFIAELERIPGGGQALEFLSKINPFIGAITTALENVEEQAGKTGDAGGRMAITITKGAQNAEASMIGLMDAQRRAMQQFDSSFRQASTVMDRFSGSLKTAVMNFGTLEQAAVRVGNTIRESFVTAFADVLKGAQTLGDALENAFEAIVDAIIEELARLAAQEVFKLVLQLIQGGQGGGVQAGTGDTADGPNVGAVAGTAIGAAVGGPVGAAIGGAIGGALGFQTGGSQVVSQPTLLGVGEHNQPEMVTVEPLSGASRGGGGAIVFQGPTIIDEITMSRFARTIAESQRRESRRRV